MSVVVRAGFDRADKESPFLEVVTTDMEIRFGPSSRKKPSRIHWSTTSAYWYRPDMPFSIVRGNSAICDCLAASS